MGKFEGNKLYNVIEFDSTLSIIDYDLVIIDFEYVFDSYEGGKAINEDAKILEDSEYTRAYLHFERRKEEIKDLLSVGKVIIIFNPSPFIFLNRSNPNVRLFLSHLFPVFPQSISSVGSEVRSIGTNICKGIWDKFGSDFLYTAYFKEPIGVPLFQVQDMPSYVGTHITYDKGHIIILPYIDSILNTKIIHEDFLTEVRQMVNTLNGDDEQFTLPSWTNDYYLPNEKNINNKIENLNEDLLKINEQIASNKTELENLKSLKILFSGTGTPLEKQVEKIFSYMGFEVKEGEKGRDDLIMEYNGKIAVVEVKGVMKSAAEKNAAQLEKWVMQYLEVNEIKPKGILVVNSYKDTPLKSRSKEGFPHQMLKMSTQREHCLISSIQLLSLYIECLNDPSKKEKIINSLFDTIGVYKHSDWEDILELDEK